MRTKMLTGCITIVWAVLCCGYLAAGNPPADELTDIDRAVLSGRVVSRLEINLIGPEKNSAGWTDMAATLIGLSEGDLFSPVLLRQSIDYLENCGRFADVRADVYPTGETVGLRFYLTVNRVIRKIVIDIKGRDGVFESDVLNVMSVYPGKSFSDREAAEQKKIVAELLKDGGFPSPTVEIAAHEDTDDYTVLLNVTVTLGPWHAIRAIHMAGNRSFSSTRLKSRMKTWRKRFFYGASARFNERVLNSDIESLTMFYRKKGFAEAVVDYTVDKAREDNGVAISVQIDEGPRYEIEFSGNDGISDRSLKKEVAVFSRGNHGDMGVRKSVQNIKSRYGSTGYLKVNIAAEEDVRQTEDGAQKQIRFVIDEGRRTVVRSFEIRGNTVISAEKIDKQVLTRARSWKNAGAYVPSLLDADIRAIRRLYRQSGFHHIRVEKNLSFTEDGAEVDIVLEIDEGNRARVSSVRFEGLHVVTKTRALKALRLVPDAIFDGEAVGQDKIELAALISEKGHPHVRVESSIIMADDGRIVDIVYHVEEGPEVAMGEIYVAGNLRTKESVVRREMEMAEGEPFSLTKMIKSQQNLRSLKIFKAVDFTPVGLREKDERVHLFIETLEKKPFFIELDAGYDSEQGGCGKMAAGDYNLLGSNRSGYISWKISETGYRGDLGVRSPRFLATRASSVFNLYMEETEAFNQDFGVKIEGASFGVNRQWRGGLSTSIAVNAENRRQYPLSSSRSGDEEYERRRAVAVTPGIVYDTRDNVMMPTRGLLGSCNVTFSRGIDSRPDDFIRYQGAVRYYRSFFESVTVALIGRAGYIDPGHASTPVSDDQLFFLGGISSVRGFEENMLLSDESGDPVGGRLSLSGSVEARMALRKAISLVVFYDIGKLDRAYIPADTETRSSVGVGLGYRTPVGPISLYYGVKLDRKAREDAGRLHLSIGYTF